MYDSTKYDPARLSQLILDNKKGIISQKDKDELQAWMDESPENKQFVENGLTIEGLVWHLDWLLGDKEEEVKAKLWTRLQQLGPHLFTVKSPNENGQKTDNDELPTGMDYIS